MTKDEFINWIASSQTKEVFRYFEEKREGIKEIMASGGIPEQNRERTIGLCLGYADILAIEFNDFQEEDNDTRDKTP